MRAARCYVCGAYATVRLATADAVRASAVMTGIEINLIYMTYSHLKMSGGFWRFFFF